MNDGNGILFVMSNERDCEGDESQKQQMKKIEPERRLVTFFNWLEDPMIPHPKACDYDKTNKVRDEIRNLFEQISSERCIGEPGRSGES